MNKDTFQGCLRENREKNPSASERDTNQEPPDN